MKKFIITEKLSANLKNNNFLWLDFIKNSQKNDIKTTEIVEEIIEDVKSRGDIAIIELTNKFDKTNASKIADLIISKKEILASDNPIISNVKIIAHGY